MPIGNKERHGSHIARLKIMNKMELFDIENFPDKTYTYQLFFNLVKPDTYKENKTPWDIVKEKNLNLPKDICMLTPSIPDNMIHREYINSVYHLCPAPLLCFLF